MPGNSYAGISLEIGQPAGKTPLFSKPARSTRAFSVTLTLIAVFAVAIAIAFVLESGKTSSSNVTVAEYGFSAFFAGLVGFAELSQRYRDDPIQLFLAVPTAVYISINALAGAAALGLAKDFDVFANNAHQDLYQVMLASFGSIAFFRSSLFTARVGSDDVDVGPATLLKSLLVTVDTAVNRAQAVDRSNDIVDIMPKISFEKSQAALPSLCFTLVEDIPDDRQQEIATAILNLSNAKSLSDIQKSKILGVYLLREVGAQVLKRAVEALGDDIKDVPATRKSEATPEESVPIT